MDVLRENAFFVLGLPLTAARAEIERTGQRLLAELALKRQDALYYATPLGREPRTEERVRAALAELRIPERRFVHELWARAPLSAAAQNDQPALLAWSEAARILGLRVE